jgi:hypothetical protein
MAGPQPARAQTPPRITGRYVVIKSTELNSASPKRIVAQCDPGDQVLGGGGGAFADGDDFQITQRRLELKRIAPFGGSNPTANPHGFEAIASETQETGGQWWVSVRALCARNPVAGHQIVSSYTTFSSPPSQTIEATCPQGRSALGSGAALNFLFGGTSGPVGMTAARPLPGGDLTRARAVERPGGYDLGWQLVSYAICATTPLGYDVVESRSTGQFANADCPAGRQILDAGGRADTTLRVAIPFSTVDEAAADAPRNANPSFVAAYAICASTTPG